MSTRVTPPLESYYSDSETSYFLGSYDSSTETDSDVPGPGRLLGKAYSYLGKKFENSLSKVAVKFGLGPRATALKMRRLIRKGAPTRLSSQKKLKKAGKRLVEYIR